MQHPTAIRDMYDGMADGHSLDGRPSSTCSATSGSSGNCCATCARAHERLVEHLDADAIRRRCFDETERSRKHTMFAGRTQLRLVLRCHHSLVGPSDKQRVHIAEDSFQQRHWSKKHTPLSIINEAVNTTPG